MSNYQKRQGEIRQQAMDWQLLFANVEITDKQFAEANLYFYQKGNQYGLLREFKENGII